MLTMLEMEETLEIKYPCPSSLWMKKLRSGVIIFPGRQLISNRAKTRAQTLRNSEAHSHLHVCIYTTPTW